MNKHILVVQGWLINPDNYTQKQLDDNYSEAFANAVCESAESYEASVARAASNAADTARYLNEYFEITYEDRQDYIDEINVGNKKINMKYFNQGVIWACARINELHDQPVIANDVILEANIPDSDFYLASEYDLKFLRSINKDIPRGKE